MFTITMTSTGATSIIFFILGLTIYNSWKKEKKSDQLKYFMIFLLSFGIQQLLFAFGSGPAVGNVLASKILWVSAHAFMFVGIAYLLRFAMRVKFPQAEKKFFHITLYVSAICEIIMAATLGSVSTFLLSNGIFNWKVPAWDGAIIGIFTGVCLLFSCWIFVSEARRLSTKILKIRSLVIAAGILFFFIGGPMHNFITTPLMNFFADAVLVGSVIIMAFGVYMTRVIHQPQISGEPVKNTVE